MTNQKNDQQKGKPQKQPQQQSGKPGQPNQQGGSRQPGENERQDRNR